MKVNVYDFDGTIYNGDSSIDFFFFCTKKNIKCLFIIPKYLVHYFLYVIKKESKTELKEIFFSFLKYFHNIDNVVTDFWKINKMKIKSFYLEKNHSNDIIISASPEFLLKPILDEIKVKDLIASEVHKTNGKFLSVNCKGKEKVKRLLQKYPNVKIMEFYTDSFNDQPLIDLANKSFLVKKNKIITLNCIKK